jgi:hypothetical protein
MPPLRILFFRANHGAFFVLGESQAHPPLEEIREQGFLVTMKYKVHLAYQSLKQKFDPQENVCAGLRHASKLELFHAGSITEEELAHQFSEFLKARISKHRLWLWVDGGLALLGSLLTPIPGPNVFFMYPAVRTLSHYLALKGAKRARHITMLSFRVESLLDRVQNCLDDLTRVENEIQELEEKYHLHNLRYLLEKL